MSVVAGEVIVIGTRQKRMTMAMIVASNNNCSNWKAIEVARIAI